MPEEDFTYRGYDIEELQKMSINEFKEVAGSRVRRKIDRGFDEQEKKLMEKAEEVKGKGTDTVIKTHLRDMVILPDFVGLKFGIHKGNDFEVVKIQPEMIGHYLGEFTMTRKKVEHGGPGIGATRSSKYVPLK
ncbi:MAG: Ribosomal protein S19 [Candidatus Methanohalarchaeum thermophilum]|uniref:Small ribosomal subunit protein uS19 n=1 Tax=Methanohalarchaeum thermophilum TaxID=1903181 RepID=A0A1Q6DX11_METT1|nr:MAG: Ribosomal protein S19 [Candidatus Methanohalarchaeum thermophilum]